MLTKLFISFIENGVYLVIVHKMLLNETYMYTGNKQLVFVVVKIGQNITNLEKCSDGEGSNATIWVANKRLQIKVTESYGRGVSSGDGIQSLRGSVSQR